MWHWIALIVCFCSLFFALGWWVHKWVHKDIPTGSAKTDDDISDRIENEDALER